ncbi:MSCRAMM family protein [Kitasatospora sp. LaBMicrA B282]|uniref:MSCRAMM family protein n=1 Tax=Kitasatospora sp. LaBMicrA B282 TaxID=3420949 RepID=UPI003D0C6466
MLDTGGAAIAGARLTVVDRSGRRLDEGRARQDGSCELSVPDCGEYVLLAGAHGHLPQAAEVVVASPGQSVEATLRLPRAAMVCGTVTDDCLRMPVPEVLLVAMDEAGVVLGSARSDAAGRYELVGLRPGGYRLVTVHHQHDLTVRPVEVTGREPVWLNVELSRRPLRFGGVVRDRAGRPVERLSVKLADRSGSELCETTDGEGRFNFASVPVGRYTLVIDAAASADLQVLLDRDHPDVEVTVPRG